MSYISKVWCLIDILAEDPFKRYLSFFLASCMRSNLNILGSWIFNPVMGCSMFFFSLPYRKWWWSPKATEKMQGDYFHEVRHRIAGDATEFRRKQKVNLWELSQRSRHSRSRQTFLWQIIFSISANLLFPFPISAFYRRQSEREQINQSLRLHRKPQVHSVFFLVNLLFDFIINYSNWLSWLMTRPGCEKQQKNGPNAHWKTDCHCILYTLKYVFLVKCSIMLLVIFGLF